MKSLDPVRSGTSCYDTSKQELTNSKNMLYFYKRHSTTFVVAKPVE